TWFQNSQSSCFSLPSTVFGSWRKALVKPNVLSTTKRSAVMGEKIKSIAINVVSTPFVLAVPGRSKYMTSGRTTDWLTYSDALSKAFSALHLIIGYAFLLIVWNCLIATFL